jgi:hypothetical protein
MAKWLLLAAVTMLPAQQPCEDLARLKLDKVTITSAQLVPAAAAVPAHCEVKLTARPTLDSEIRIEVWLPAEGWNGKYQQVGNGGWAGAIPTGSLATAIRRGYAAAGTDDGHDRSIPGAVWAIGHPEKLIDFGHRALKETTNHAKAVIRAHYGRDAERSYFVGCSDGGREALMEAQRYPEDFDGIVAGAPANDWSALFTSFVWNQQALLKEPGSAIPAAKLEAIQKAAVAACDALDGVKDGLIEDPRKCQFDPGAIACQAGSDADDCLTPPQVVAVRRIYQGPKNSRTGRQIHPGMAPGTEAVKGSWVPWATTVPPEKSLQHMFGASFYGHAVFEDPNWDIKSLEFDADVEYGRQKAGVHLDSSSPDLRTFRARGGKLIQYHGWGDAAIPVPGPADRDVLTALETWVEKGVAPAQLIGTGITGTTPSQELTRPLCAYPQTPRYKGSGDTNSAASFSCAAP